MPPGIEDWELYQPIQPALVMCGSTSSVVNAATMRGITRPCSRVWPPSSRSDPARKRVHGIALAHACRNLCDRLDWLATGVAELTRH